MAFDYSDFVTVAKDMITEFGRTVTFVKLDTTPVDANEPWNGATDPEATPDDTEDVVAIWVDPINTTGLGLRRFIDPGLVNRLAGIFISPQGTVDLEDFDQIIDGTQRYRIEFVDKLRPANDTILYFVGVSK